MKKAKQKTIFLATANPNKKKEVQAWLGRKVRVKTLADDPRTSRMPLGSAAAASAHPPVVS